MVGRIRKKKHFFFEKNWLNHLNFFSELMNATSRIFHCKSVTITSQLHAILRIMAFSIMSFEVMTFGIMKFCILKFGIITLGIMRLGIMRLGIMRLGIMRLGSMRLGIMTFDIMTVSMSTRKCDFQLKLHSA
jgi:hypothetical protein